jgi:flagellar biosynthesis/type III secretory pathway chaperone
VTISGLCALAGRPAADALRAAGERLRAQVEAVQEANRRNAELLQACLASVSASVLQLMQVGQVHPHYGSNGGRAEAPPAPRLRDYRA